MKSLLKIFEEIKKAKGNPYFVGGYVRDHLLGIANKDIDIEVFNINLGDLVSILNKFGQIKTVGVSFGVIKLTIGEVEFDFSLPRTENKIGNGSKGFIVETNQNINTLQASERRDFTFNALLMTPDGRIIDHHNGIEHLEKRIIKHTSLKFAEDPLRVLRGFQFAGRFGMSLNPSTASLCNKLKSEAKYLSKERIWGEWWKWASKSTSPSMGLKFLADAGWLISQLKNLMGCPQNSEWHPEGDVWTHTLHVCDEAVKIAERQNLNELERGILVLSSVCHDMGKPLVTKKDSNNRWVSPKHNNPRVANDFLESIGCPKSIKEVVLKLVEEHMVHLNPVSEKSVKRLILRLKPAKTSQLIALIEADANGRPPLVGGLPNNAKRIKEIQEKIGDRILPILKGRHLINMGMRPGKHFGPILEEAWQAQINGEFNTLQGGISWLESKRITKTSK